MRIGLVVKTARSHDARIAACPADSADARCKLPGQFPGLATPRGDTVSALATDDLEASDVEAADLLALARLDDDGAPSLSRSGAAMSAMNVPAVIVTEVVLPGKVEPSGLRTFTA